MSLIKKQKQEVLKRLSVRLESELLDALTAYATYLESTRDYVIAEAVRYIIDRDKDFAQSLPQNLRQNLPQILPQISPTNVGESVHRNVSGNQQTKGVGK